MYVVVYRIGGLNLILSFNRHSAWIKPSVPESIPFVQSVSADQGYCNEESCIKVCIDSLPRFFSSTIGEEIFSQEFVSFYRTEKGYLHLFYSGEDKRKLLWELDINAVFSEFNYYVRSDNLLDEEKPSLLDPWKIAASLFFLQYSFIHRQGLIIHAGGGLIQGKGMIFSAPSGGGKSTLSRLLLQSPKTRLFSEERLIVRSVDNVWKVWGSPWHGESRIAENKSAQLSALVFLRQSLETTITRLSPSEGLHRLIQTASIPWYSEEWIDKGLAICERLLQDIPVFELAFRPDQSAVQIVERFSGEL